MANQIVIAITGDITEMFKADSWRNGIIWDYHVPVLIAKGIEDGKADQLIRNIGDSMGHAGLHLLCSSSPLEASVKQGIIDACLASGTPIVSPANIPGKRFRGHDDHQAYIYEVMDYIREHHLPSRPEYPCVPSNHLEDDQMGDGDILAEDGITIEHRDGTISVPIHMVSVNHP
eukprot:s4575_g5.t1